jgi:hypothetical protein
MVIGVTFLRGAQLIVVIAKQSEHPKTYRWCAKFELKDYLK